MKDKENSISSVVPPAVLLSLDGRSNSRTMTTTTSSSTIGSSSSGSSSSNSSSVTSKNSGVGRSGVSSGSSYSPISSLLNALSGAASSGFSIVGSKGTASSSSKSNNNADVSHMPPRRYSTSGAENHVNHNNSFTPPSTTTTTEEGRKLLQPGLLPKVTVDSVPSTGEDPSKRRSSFCNVNGPSNASSPKSPSLSPSQHQSSHNLKKPIKLKNHLGHAVELYDSLHSKNTSSGSFQVSLSYLSYNLIITHPNLVKVMIFFSMVDC